MIVPTSARRSAKGNAAGARAPSPAASASKIASCALGASRRMPAVALTNTRVAPCFSASMTRAACSKSGIRYGAASSGASANALSPGFTLMPFARVTARLPESSRTTV